ncbi:MAG: low specificity L-threonine aldolase [Bacteroidales bacterium]|jgi:threonine aldolase|nr:low specificity L-threonine aldolase [Bacteroidales bacterium]MDD3272615.1 low specificity L-threonine aldolase [Bacteroidales bacterium]MDD4058171.1 low specificity L-threonine aldolase [Bacteroidales bacterium]
MKHSFGSDNHSGAAPEILEAIAEANNDFQVAYGEDDYTKRAIATFKKVLGDSAIPYFVFNGTGANILALKALTNTYNSILCPESAHINVDECGAPEKMTGAKIIPLPPNDGKVTPEVVKKELKGFGFQHHSQPKVLSISQPTELGTLYKPEEIKALADLMHSHNGYLHVDGSRISNAAASLGLPIKEFITDQGVDALSFGGTKNGLLIGEAVVFFKEDLANNFLYIRKQGGQLFSKNRFIAAQFDAFLRDGLNIKLASHSNSMAKYLESELKGIKDVIISRPVETNVVFAIIPEILCKKLMEKHYFYVWDKESGEVRWMCSFNTTKEDIDNFVYDIKSLI